jgi:pyridoxine kinase
MGDRHTGLYVAGAVADEIAGPLLSAADLVTPNGFELELLAGATVTTLDQARAAAERLRAQGPELVVCTSPIAPTDTLGTLDTAATLAVNGEGAWLVETPALSAAPHGAGDLFAALFLGRYLEGGDVAAALAHAVSASFGVLRASVSQERDELALIAAQDEIVAPSRRFEVTKLG